MAALFGIVWAGLDRRLFGSAPWAELDGWRSGSAPWGEELDGWLFCSASRRWPRF